MHELRKDYIFNRWVIVNTERAKRPKDFIKQHPKIKEEGPCPFCTGNERLTPPEIARVTEGKDWIIRVFPNKFPAVTLKGSSEVKTRDDFFTSGDAFGQHEVIVETPNHSEQLSSLSVDRIKQLLQMYAQRIKSLYKVKGIKFVAVFKNHGLESGTSLSHEHSQVIAYNKMPVNVMREVRAIESYYRKHRKCPYCSVVDIERKGPRRIAENDSFFAFAPYASIFEFEAGIFSKRHATNLGRLNDSELRDLAELIKKILVKLAELDAPYNMYLHEAPPGRKHHLHIKFTPRLITWGGFEHCTGCIINTVSPEQAAEFYREQPEK